jgi:hypothetical protein
MRPKIVALAFLFVAHAAQAQNGFSAAYDASRQIKLSGPVTQIQWVNPHAFVFINHRDASGIVTNWAVEIGNPLDLEHAGWKSTTVKIGDVLTVNGVPVRGQAHRAFAKTVIRSGENFKPLFTLPSHKADSAVAKEPAPRWPDGQVRLGPAPGKKGYWGAASANALLERGASPSIPMNDEGLLSNLSDADRVAPMQPWAKAVYEYRQRNLLKDDPFLRCMPPGGPRQFQTPHGFQFIEQKELGRILILHGGGDRNWRVIYTDGRPQGQADEVVRSFYGNSVGHWEDKDTLVVDTIGFNEKFWFTNGGLPHTEALHLIERFSRPDLNTLKYEVTVDDPNTYTRQWTGGWTVQWVPNEEIQEYFCEENAESILLR